MEIYVVQAGDTLNAIAQRSGLSAERIASENRLFPPHELVVGQTLVLRFPDQVYTARSGDTLYSVARASGVPVRQLYRNNTVLEGSPTLYPGQTVVLSYQGDSAKYSPIAVNGYAYPFIDPGLLRRTLPFLTYITPFTYGIQPDGALVPLEDQALLTAARNVGTGALMHLSTLTDEGSFSNELASLVLNDQDVQGVLIDNVLNTLEAKGYSGLDVDFEFVFPQDAAAYASFIRRLRERLNPRGYPVVVALAPKTSADQPGLLYEGHDYRALGAAADRVFLMTYEWGYTYGPPMAVAPLPNVRAVLDYAVTELPAEKLLLGVPNYGYDWPLPFVQGQTRAKSISNQQAIDLALQYRIAIQYDQTAQSPYFHYTAEDGIIHEVWFEDARSLSAKLRLIAEYGFSGGGIWNLMRPFSQIWLLADSLYDIV